ncbi:hypothetical protein [Azospirillum agricola]|uniref:hypothetical protein n=1 Tax=Azospirillum agricola TaxID=1720247 RepID=UPI0015C4DED5|nr:hypothetical protein [Azospirillum agricola]
MTTMFCYGIVAASLGVLLLSGIGFSLQLPSGLDKPQTADDTKRRAQTEDIMG